MNAAELKTILDEHKKWLADSYTGSQTDLRGANLCGADLRGANLADTRKAIVAKYGENSLYEQQVILAGKIVMEAK